jgi:hypothetical protein
VVALPLLKAGKASTFYLQSVACVHTVESLSWVGRVKSLYCL